MIPLLVSLSILAAVVAAFAILVAVGSGISRVDQSRIRDDRRMINHIARTYPRDDT